MKKILGTLILASCLVVSCQKNGPQLVDVSSPSFVPHLPDHSFRYTPSDIPDHFKDHPVAKELKLALGFPLHEEPDTEQQNGDQVDVISSPVQDIINQQPPLRKDIPTITDAGATLGRVLFYDRNLSISNTVSCGTCHLQEHAFADAKVTSTGFRGEKTKRNSMAIINTGLNENMFWDARSPTVRTLVLNPISDHIEMGMESLEYLEQKLSQKAYYRSLFEEAYGSNEITRAGIAEALTQFVCAMITFDAKFDRNVETQFSAFSEQEKLGHQLFFGNRAKCSSCHAPPNFAAPDFPGGAYSGIGVAGSANIGLSRNYADPGRGQGKFRIPSLRNIALTGPYMHDGRFDNLMDVINHYDHGVQSHSELDEKLVGPNGLPQRLQLAEYEKEALVAFMQTLTDWTLIEDERFSDPFE